MPSKLNWQEGDMTAMEYLSQPLALMEEIRCDLDNLASLRSMVERVTTNLSFTAGRNPSKDPYAFENTMLDIREEEEKIWAKTERLKKLLLEIARQLNCVPGRYSARLLRMRYIEGKKWREIAEELNVSYMYVFELHREALKDFEKSLADRSLS